MSRRFGWSRVRVMLMVVTSCGVHLAASAEAQSEPVEPELPHNVIVVVADDIGHDMVSVYEQFYAGQPPFPGQNRTPTLEHLATSGLVFRNCWTNPVCSPTRAQILTGRHASKNGVGRIVKASQTDRPGLHESIPTIPTMLRSAPIPYETAAIGKWHLFGGAATVPLDHALGLDPTVPWFHTFWGSMYNIGNYNWWPKAWTSPPPGGDPCSGAYPCSNFQNVYATTDTADDAIWMVENLQEPFFLYAAFHAPHTPIDASTAGLVPASCTSIAGVVDCPGFTAGDNKPYDTRCMVQWLDNELGRLICALEESPHRPTGPTTIIFIGDNGSASCDEDESPDCAGTSPIVAPFDPLHGKTTLYQGGVNVPLIVISPLMDAQVRGTTSDVLVNSTDILATAAELAGAALPSPTSLLESVSMVPYFLGQPTSDRSHAYAEWFGQNFVPDPVTGAPLGTYACARHDQTVRNVDGSKLIRFNKRNPMGGVDVTEELYYLPTDPHEQIDIKDSTRPEVMQALAELQSVLNNQYPHLVQ